MLDVHAPEHGIHGVRDFLIHLLTITAGLIIALALEAGVEALHHRHQREQAEQTIRAELTENRTSLLKMQDNTRVEIDNAQKSLLFLEDLRAGKKDDPSGIHLGFNVSPLQSAAWSSASATGALSYLPYDEVQRFATAYHEQQMYEDAVERALGNYEILDTFLISSKDPRTMPPQDIEQAVPDVRQSLSDLGAMSDWGRCTLHTYDDALKP